MYSNEDKSAVSATVLVEISNVDFCATLNQKIETNIPRNETARPRSQFLHSCIGERFIYSHDRSAYFAIKRSQIHECRNWERGRTVSFLGVIVSTFRYNAFAVNLSGLWLSEVKIITLLQLLLF
jgi:hypothetical protein